MAPGLLLVASLLFARLPLADEIHVEFTETGARLTLGTDERRVEGHDPQTIAEAWMRLVDSSRGFSTRPAWRRINRWSNPLFGSPKPANTALDGFVGAFGDFSPHDDFVSFAAAALLQPHDGSDNRPGCRLRTQWRFLMEALASLPAESQPVEPPREPVCPAFERWADATTLSHFELILAAPSSASAGSLFGHLFLRLVRSDGSMRDHETLAFLAQNDVPIEADPFYAVKGLTGVYTARLVEQSLPRTLNEYVVREGRNLDRFRLNLTEQETAAFLDRLWTGRNALELPYYFLQENCATMLLELLRDVLEDDATFTLPRFVGTSPTAAVESLALVQRADGTPLLVAMHETFTSLRQEALDAVEARREAEAALLVAYPHQAETFAAAKSGDDRKRAEAIATLGREMENEPSAAVDEWLAAQATIELHLSRQANAQEEKNRNRIRMAKLSETAREVCARLPSLEEATKKLEDDDRDTRHQGYEALAGALANASPSDASIVRQCAALHLIRHYGDRLQLRPDVREPLFFVDPSLSLEDQPWAEPVRDLLAFEHVTTLTPGVAAIAKARRFRKSALDHLPRMAVINARWRAERTERAAKEHSRNWPYTGLDRTTIGASVATDGWAMQLGGSVYDERLGDRRRYGFPGHTALTILASDWNIGRWQDSTRIITSHLRLVGRRSMRPALAEETGAFGRLGWDAFLDIERSLPRGISNGARLGVGLLLPLAASRDLSTHLLVRAGGDVAASLGESELGVAYGPAARLGAEARWTPSFTDGWHYVEALVEARSARDFRAGMTSWDLRARAGVSLGLIDGVAMPFVGHAGVRLSAIVRHERATGPFLPSRRTSAECLFTFD